MAIDWKKPIHLHYQGGTRRAKVVNLTDLAATLLVEDNAGLCTLAVVVSTNTGKPWGRQLASSWVTNRPSEAIAEYMLLDMGHGLSFRYVREADALQDMTRYNVLIKLIKRGGIVESIQLMKSNKE